MNLNEYQMLAMRFRLPSANEDYAIMNLAGEAGEVLSLRAKAIRDGVVYSEFQTNLMKELGDVLWHVAAVADDYDLSLKDIATHNLLKLESRKARNVIQGNGDNR
jgi:NTP pyrophosphatase (non-canonical NTP hydrolase)